MSKTIQVVTGVSLTAAGDVRYIHEEVPTAKTLATWMMADEHLREQGLTGNPLEDNGLLEAMITQDQMVVTRVERDLSDIDWEDMKVFTTSEVAVTEADEVNDRADWVLENLDRFVDLDAVVDQFGGTLPSFDDGVF